MNQENQMNIVIKEFNKFNKKTLLSKTRMRVFKIPNPQGGAQSNKVWRIYCSRVGGANPVHAEKVHLSSG